MVWYSHLFQNFPQFIVIHTVKGFGIVNKAEIDVFLEPSCVFDDLADAGNLIAGSLAVIHQQYTGSYWCSGRGRGSEVLWVFSSSLSQRLIGNLCLRLWPSQRFLSFPQW